MDKAIWKKKIKHVKLVLQYTGSQPVYLYFTCKAIKDIKTENAERNCHLYTHKFR